MAEVGKKCAGIGEFFPDLGQERGAAEAIAQDDAIEVRMEEVR